MRPPSLLRMPSSAFESLSSSDQVVLANIFYAYENTCIVAKNVKFQYFPVVQHTSIHDFFNEVAVLFPVFIDYFKHIPEFANNTLDDKLRLVKNHFGLMLNINEPLMHPVTSSNLIATWTNIYGVEIAGRLLKRNQILEQFLYDPILLKLLLIILVLSSSNGRMLESTDIDQICDYPLPIYAAQNIYVELLWRYLLSRAASEEDALRFFNKLMLCIMHMKNVHMYVYDYINNFPDEIRQMEPIMRSMWPLKDAEEDFVNIDLAKTIDLAKDIDLAKAIDIAEDIDIIL
jgi:hypothetical protein